jgi:hypothetical protein
MRKVLIGVLAIAALGIASASFAGIGLEFNVSVTVRSAAVDISSPTPAANNLDWGVLAPNITAVSKGGDWATKGNTPTYQLVNSGGAAVDLKMYQNLVSGWTLASVAAPGTTRTASAYRLFAVFSGYTNTVTAASFAADDFIPVGTTTTANATVGGIFAASGVGTSVPEGGAGPGLYNGGWNVMPETGAAPDQFKGTRALLFCLDTPVLADGSAKNLDVVVLAGIH